MLVWIIIFSIIGSLGSIISASGFLILKKETQNKMIPLLIAFANGTLLTSALLGLIPEALEESGGNVNFVFTTILFGIIAFFLLEKLIVWHHCHETACELVESQSATGPVILVGDFFHNAIDGVVIAAAFLSSFTLGLAVSLSVIAHEVSQEIGDFAILLHTGYTQKKALMYNYLSSSSTILVAILSFFILDVVHDSVPFIMAISAASFIYIALVDIAPELHKRSGFGQVVKQLLLIVSGVIVMLIVFQFHAHAG